MDHPETNIIAVVKNRNYKRTQDNSVKFIVYSQVEGEPLKFANVTANMALDELGALKAVEGEPFFRSRFITLEEAIEAIGDD